MTSKKYCGKEQKKLRLRLLWQLAVLSLLLPLIMCPGSLAKGVSFQISKWLVGMAMDQESGVRRLPSLSVPGHIRIEIQI